MVRRRPSVDGPTSTWSRRAALWWALGAALAVVPVTLAGLALLENLASPESWDWADLRPHLLCLSLIGFNVITYSVWPSRWNVLAHTQLAFSIVAYVVPIYGLGLLDQLSERTLDVYFRVVIVGFLAALPGVLVGRRLGDRSRWPDRLRSVQLDDDAHLERISRRLLVVAASAVVAVCLAFAVMGFVPAFAADPLVAKFFRGSYAEAYAPVAPLYRAGTGVISLLMPLILYFAWKRGTAGWVATAIGSLGVMFLALTRGPAASGVLLLLGVVVAVRYRRALLLYFSALLGSYVIGSVFYVLLGALGLGAFSAAGTSSGGLLEQVAGGAPDLYDHVLFLQQWLTRPEYTNGLTFVGGLVPGHFQWDTAVYTLRVVNPGADIGSITSGGLRLPTPVWGLVSFGWPGVLATSFGYGLLSAYLARIAARLVPSPRVAVSLCWVVLYSAAAEVVVGFYHLDYVSVMQLVIAALLLLWRPGPRAGQEHPEAVPSGVTAAAVGAVTRQPVS